MTLKPDRLLFSQYCWHGVEVSFIMLYCVTAVLKRALLVTVKTDRPTRDISGAVHKLQRGTSEAE